MGHQRTNPIPGTRGLDATARLHVKEHRGNLLHHHLRHPVATLDQIEMGHLIEMVPPTVLELYR